MRWYPREGTYILIQAPEHGRALKFIKLNKVLPSSEVEEENAIEDSGQAQTQDLWHSWLAFCEVLVFMYAFL
jgi:hypothetical protein